MNGFSAFLKKEFLEQMRSYRALVLLLILLAFGIISPVFAKIMPDIFAGMQVEGFTITIPEPTELDAYGQFFKNIGQMGFLAVLLIFGSGLSHELSAGTLTMLLSKGLSRDAVILSKFTAELSLWTVGYSLAAAVNYGYTLYFFGKVDPPNLLFSLCSMWLFGVFAVALLLIAGVLIPGNYGGLLLTGGILVVLIVLQSFPSLALYTPMALASENIALLTEATKPQELIPVLLITVGLTLASLFGAIALFRKKSL